MLSNGNGMKYDDKDQTSLKKVILALHKMYLVDFHQLIRCLHLLHLQRLIIILKVVYLIEIHCSIIDLLRLLFGFLSFGLLLFSFPQLLLLFFSQLLRELWARMALRNVYLTIFILLLGILILLLFLNDHYFFSSLVFQAF
jgi:hypothetical protein